MNRFCLMFLFIWPAVALGESLEVIEETCTGIGFSAGTIEHGDCVLRLVKLTNKAAQRSRQFDRARVAQADSQRREVDRARVAEAESQRQQEQIERLTQLAEEAERDRKLDAAIDILGAVARGESIFAPPRQRAGGRSGLGGLRTCSYQVGTQIASHTVSAATACPARMSFGGVVGFLKP